MIGGKVLILVEKEVGGCVKRMSVKSKTLVRGVFGRLKVSNGPGFWSRCLNPKIMSSLGEDPFSMTKSSGNGNF